jgi:hypothetical protein
MRLGALVSAALRRNKRGRGGNAAPASRPYRNRYATLASGTPPMRSSIRATARPPRWA